MGLFSIKPSQTPNEPQQQLTLEEKYQERRRNYKKLGIMDAGSARGESTPLESNINAAAGKIQQELANDHDLQEAERDKIRKEIAELKTQKENAETRLKDAQQQLEFKEGQIEETKKDIADIRQHPEKVLDNPATKASFVIGLFILLPLTIYLLVFYSSASYSAFFREISINTQTSFVATVLDPQAVVNAFQAGWTEGLFVCLMPFIFLGLGYLIHKFGEETSVIKRCFKVGGIIVVTFIFDCLIAFNIEKKIYDFTTGGGMSTNVAPYDFNMALHSPEFWLIIFSGFIVYIIWGFVFDFVMDSYTKLDKVNVAINELKKKLQHLKDKCTEYRSMIQNNTQDIQRLTHQIESKNAELSKVVYPRNILLDCLNSYLSGWLQYLAGIGAWQQKQDEAKAIGEAAIAKYNN